MLFCLVFFLSTVDVFSKSLVLCFNEKNQIESFKVRTFSIIEFGRIQAMNKNFFDPKMDVIIEHQSVIDQDFLHFIENITKKAREIKSVRILLRIDSPGGDVNTAIKIGRILFNHQVDVRIFGCNSACVILIAGARNRRFENSIGIHRPFPVNVENLSSDNFLALQNKLSDSSQKIGIFFDEMGVSRRLLSEMMSISSTNMRYLDSEEAEKYGIGRINIAHAELSKIGHIKKCGKKAYEKLMQIENARDVLGKRLVSMCSESNIICQIEARIEAHLLIKWNGCEYRRVPDYLK